MTEQYRKKVYGLEEQIRDIEETWENIELEYVNVGGKDSTSGEQMIKLFQILH